MAVLAGLVPSAGCGRIGVKLLDLPATASDAGPTGDGDANPTGEAGIDGGGDGDGGMVDSCASDRDGDGTADCNDACPDDAEKMAAGGCGCGMSDTDTDGDGMPDCVDDCGGSNDADYMPDISCGVGYCQMNNTPSTCADGGVETACVAGNPLTGTDTTCNGVDDNCDGVADEGYVPVTQCGLGYCRTTSTPSSCNAGVETPCQPGAPLSSTDATADGVDDNCDGAIDNNACNPHSETLTAGVHALAQGACTTITVKLWGAGGCSGKKGGNWGANIKGGTGGAGGYAQHSITVSAGQAVSVIVGRGGQQCGETAGPPSDTYKGGKGATSSGGSGNAGGDGSVMGGAGGKGAGGNGGNGSFGGGGGAAGSEAYSSYGSGGEGGGATVLLVNGTRVASAGGGGGGGGAGADFTTAGKSGGNAGAGCSAAGAAGTAGIAGGGGGAGGGGVCEGTTTQAGSGRTPANPGGDALPTDTATGGNNDGDCKPGGTGYAIVTYGP
ncbi:MAG: hypothetical protein QM778_16425 [Myxococcales bacterium]